MSGFKRKTMQNIVLDENLYAKSSSVHTGKNGVLLLDS